MFNLFTNEKGFVDKLLDAALADNINMVKKVIDEQESDIVSVDITDGKGCLLEGFRNKFRYHRNNKCLLYLEKLAEHAYYKELKHNEHKHAKKIENPGWFTSVNKRTIKLEKIQSDLVALKKRQQNRYSR